MIQQSVGVRYKMCNGGANLSYVLRGLSITWVNFPGWYSYAFILSCLSISSSSSSSSYPCLTISDLSL